MNLHFQMHVMILESFQYLFFTFGGSYQFPQEFCAELCLIGVRLLLVANTAIVLKQTQFPYSQDTRLTCTERSLQCIVCDGLHSCSALNSTDLQRQPFEKVKCCSICILITSGSFSCELQVGVIICQSGTYDATHTPEKKSTFNQP